MDCLDISQYSIELAACPETIIIRGELALFSAFFVQITDKFNNKYILGCNTDADGVLVDDSSIVPVGSFNPHAGAFVLRVMDYNHSGLMLTFQGVHYESVPMTFAETSDPDGYQNNVIP